LWINELETARLRFRLYTDEDFPFLFSLLSDAETVRYIGNGQVRTKEEALQFMGWIQNHYATKKGTGLLLIVGKEDGQPLGHAGLVPQQIEGIDEIEVGYWISRPYWGNGLASEAVNALLQYGKSLDIQRIVALIQPENRASVNVATKCGLDFEKSVLFKEREVSLYTIR